MKLSTTLIFLLIASMLFSQTNDGLVNQKELDLLDLEKHKSLDKSLPITPSYNNNTVDIRGGDDSDDDGMDDNWELQNNLDPNNAEDAFGDLDGDHIVNLFEYQMGGDPNNSNSPASVVYDTTIGSLKNLLDSYVGSSIVVKVAEGTYVENTQVFYSEDSKIMIQGGWSTDFTDFDPSEYVTTFDGLSQDEVIYLGTSSFGDAQSLVMILDGLSVINGLGSFGNITMIGRVDHDFSIFRCKVSGGATRGFALHNWGGDGRVTIAQVECFNVGEQCINSQNTNDGNICWRDYNNTFTDNVIGGIEGFTLDDLTSLDYKAINCIYRDNGIDLIRNVDLSLFNCNINIYPETPDIESLVIENLIDADPQFVDPSINDYNLLDDSPCIDAGILVGLAYAGSNPDIGANESGVISNTSQLDNLIDIAIYPNPTSDFVILSKYVDSYSLFDMNGNTVTQGANTNLISLSNLPVGSYVLSGLIHDKHVIGKIQKVVAK